MTNSWIYNNKPIETPPDDCEAFCYIITNLENGMKYVGVKKFYSTITRPPLKGKKRKRKIKKESDWKTYYGSSENVKQVLRESGEKTFKREILHLCKTHSHAKYMEAKEQFLRDVLLDPMYYNGIIQCRIAASHVKGMIDYDRDPDE